MNKAQEYMVKNGAFSNASGDLSDMEQTLSTLLAEKKALENKISGHELALARRPESGAIQQAIRIDTEKRETVIAQITVVESAIESYKASPVHEQEQIVEDMQNQLEDTQTDLASQKKKYLMIGGLAVLVIGLYIVFKK
tara:strand:- start:40 stop:456 length:417 start_codon:yes stop_codon:yes gene_type:complete